MEELEFFEEWLSLEKYHFKILTMITVLADNKRAFRGKLSDFCQSLSIQKSSVNIAKIKATIVSLAEENYINTIIDKDIYTISLTRAAEKSKNVIKIKRAWYQLIRETKSTAAWESVLKVFLVLLEQPQGRNKTITYEQIGALVKCSKTTVERAIKTICSIDFKDFKFQKDIIKEKYDTENGIAYKTLGTVYIQGIYFE